jgi:hypothetical protein
MESHFCGKPIEGILYATPVCDGHLKSRRKSMSKQLFISEQRLSDAWQCQSCGCYFPGIPNLLNNDVERCSKCVEVEALEARLSTALGVISMLEHHWISPMEYYEVTEAIHERLRQIGVLATRNYRGSTLVKDLLLDLEKIEALAGESDGHT